MDKETEAEKAPFFFFFFFPEKLDDMPKVQVTVSQLID